MRQLVAEELLAIKETFGDPRRTQVVQLGAGETKSKLLTTSDLVQELPVWVMVSPDGLVSRTPDDKPPRLSGRDIAPILVSARTRDTLYLVAEDGEAAAIPMHVVPQAAKPSEGIPHNKISPIRAGQKITTAFSLPAKGERTEEWYLLSVTRQGMLKKSALSELPGPSASTFTLVRVNEGDRLGWVHLTDGKARILLATADGMAINFPESEVRPMGLVAAGVMGIKLQGRDELAGSLLLPKRGDVLLVASDGTAKRLSVDQFPPQGRYGQGVIAWKLPRDVRVAGIAAGKGTVRVTLELTGLAPKAIRLDEAPQQGRAARGKSILELKGNQRITGLHVPQEWARPSRQESPTLPTNPSARRRSGTDNSNPSGSRKPRGKQG
jgi:DNA gyrase subunit A